MPTDEPIEEVLTPREAARLMGSSVESVRRWATDGVLPSTRTPGGQRRFRRSDVEALMRGTAPAPEKAS